MSLKNELITLTSEWRARQELEKFKEKEKSRLKTLARWEAELRASAQQGNTSYALEIPRQEILDWARAFAAQHELEITEERFSEGTLGPYVLVTLSWA